MLSERRSGSATKPSTLSCNPDPSGKGFQDRLRELCVSKGWTHETLARQCAVSRQAVTRWFSSRRTVPDGRTLTTLAAASGYCVDWLLLGEGPKLRSEKWMPAFRQDLRGFLFDVLIDMEDLPSSWVIQRVLANAEGLVQDAAIEATRRWKQIERQNILTEAVASELQKLRTKLGETRPPQGVLLFPDCLLPSVKNHLG